MRLKNTLFQYLILVYFIILNSIPLDAQEFNWVSTFNGSDYVEITNLKQDQGGNYYAIGKFDGTVDFDDDPTTSNTLYSSSRSWFLLKLNPLGDLLWVKNFANIDQAFGYNLIVDNNGNVYTAGYFRNTVDFDLNSGSYLLSTTSSSDYDVFLAKYNSTGSLTWVHQVQAPNAQRCDVLSRDSTGAFYLGGSDQASASIWKFSNTGNFLWKKDFVPASSGFLINYVDNITFDSHDNVYLSGFFWTSIDADPNTGIANLTGITNGQNGFLIKLDSAGYHLWSGALSGNIMNIEELLVSKNEEVFVIGSFGTYGTGGVSDLDPGAGVVNILTNNAVDLFVLKLDSAGGYLWVKHTNSGNSTVPTSAMFDHRKDIIITGDIAMFTRFNFNPADSLVGSNGGVFDGFVLKISKNADVKFLGRWSSCDPKFMLLGNGTDIIIAGQYNLNMDFDMSSGVVRAGFTNYEDGFITNLNTCQPDSENVKVWACNSYTLPSGRLSVNADGIYTDTLFTSFGCDSILTMDVSVHHDSSITGVVSIACDVYTSPGNNYAWTSSGTYLDTILSKGGCDSIVRLFLLIRNSDSSRYSINGCGPTPSPSGKFVMNNTGQYLDTITASNGCDSVLRIDFNLINVNTSMGYTGWFFKANASNARFQWIFCENDSVLSGDTMSTYIPFANGGYKVAIFQDGCWDTSACYNIFNADLDDMAIDFAKVYPNPFTNSVTIDFQPGSGNVLLKLSSASGQVLYQEQMIGPTQHTIQFPLDQGVYILELVSDEGLFQKEILVKQSGL